MSPVLRSNELTKKYRGVVALDRLSIEVPEGSIYGLVGTNGSGKTTFIKILMNIFPASSGEAEILGVDSRKLSARELARIGYVSENQEMPDWMTVEYLLAYVKPFYPSWDDSLAAELVEQFNLPFDRKLKHLSRGMRMKAALASSLAYRPELIVLDEPFSGLDPAVRDEFIESLLDRADESTLLISSHDLSEIESFATHIGYLNAGRLQFSEEMASLTGRFREVEVTLDAVPVLPSRWPEGWLVPQTSSALIRFIDSRFDPERTAARVLEIFPAATNVDYRAMSLREIFVAMARKGPAFKTA